MRDLALSIPTFGDPVRVPDHNACHPESFGTHERQPVLLPHSSYDRTRCKGFPTAAIFQLPGLSLVSDSRSLLLVRPLLWKITLPLKSIVRCTNANASASSNFLLWKWRNKSGNSPFNEAMRVCNAWVPHSSPVFGLEWDNEVPFDPPFCLSQIPSVSLSRAFGSGTISPIRTKSLRYVLLLPSPSIVHDEHPQADIRKRAGACPNQVRSLRLWVCGDAGAYSPAGWRTRTHSLADALKSLKQGVSRRLIEESEHFWQTRYYDFNIRNRQQFGQKLYYMHATPDFLLFLVALASSIRLSLMKAAHVAASSVEWQEIRGIQWSVDYVCARKIGSGAVSVTT